MGDLFTRGWVEHFLQQKLWAGPSTPTWWQGWDHLKKLIPFSRGHSPLFILGFDSDDHLGGPDALDQSHGL